MALPRPVAFVLGGGATFGAVQVGMLQALSEDRIEPDIVVGTSVGAINGALLAEDPDGAANRLGHLWLQMTKDRVFPTGAIDLARTLHQRRSYLVRPDGLRDLLGEALAVERIEELALPFTAIATDLGDGAPFALRSGPLVPALLASAALPCVYPAVRIDGHDLIDGGVVANVPVLAALQAGGRSLVVLDCGLFGLRVGPPHGLPETVARAVAIMVRRQAVADFPAAAREVPVLHLPGPFPIRSSPLEFSDSARLMQEAYEMTRRFLATVEPTGPGLYGEPHLLTEQEIGTIRARPGDRGA